MATLFTAIGTLSLFAGILIGIGGAASSSDPASRLGETLVLAAIAFGVLAAADRRSGRRASAPPPPPPPGWQPAAGPFYPSSQAPPARPPGAGQQPGPHTSQWPGA